MIHTIRIIRSNFLVAKKTSSKPLPLPLGGILRTRVLPLWEQGGMQRCVVVPRDLTDPANRQRWLETGSRISPKPFVGKRIALKGPRNYGNRNTNQAYWPDDKLQERKSAAFAIVIGGQTDFQIGDQLLHCSSGHSIVIMPGAPRPDGSSPHLMKEHRKNGYCDLLWISGEANVGLGCWICHSEGDRHFERPGESCRISDSALTALFDQFLQEAIAQRDNYLEICQHLFQALIFAMCREMSEAHIFQFNYQRPEASLEEPREIKIHDPIPAAQAYMKNRLHLPLCIDDVAREFLLSRTEFTRRFRQQTGMSFLEYLTEVRLEEAKRLLATTAWSIEIISDAVSFKSSRLRVLFNRYLKMSPSEYRALHQKTRRGKDAF